MRAKEISLATPFYVVSLKNIVITYPTAVSINAKKEIVVALDGSYWYINERNFNSGYIGVIENRFYWDLEKAQQYQYKLRKERAEKVKRELDGKYREHEDAQRILYSPLSKPTNARLNDEETTIY